VAKFAGLSANPSGARGSEGERHDGHVGWPC
jgi:hypothetical protein